MEKNIPKSKVRDNLKNIPFKKNIIEPCSYKFYNSQFKQKLKYSNFVSTADKKDFLSISVRTVSITKILLSDPDS